MITRTLRLGFLPLIMLAVLGFSSCEESKSAKAVIEVVQEYTATQGQIHQLHPVEGAKVRIYGSRISPYEETIEFTDAEGKVSFTYPYDAWLFAEVEFDGTVYPAKSFFLKVGETTTEQIILPE